MCRKLGGLLDFFKVWPLPAINQAMPETCFQKVDDIMLAHFISKLMSWGNSD